LSLRSKAGSKPFDDVEWTFPLDFVEVVWGDEKTTGRQIISTTDLPPFGSHHFEIPLDATGKSGSALQLGTRRATTP
jgi:hypothetical protein